MADDAGFEDKYLDVLQNIEFAIVSVHREYPELSDSDVLDALEALIRSYIAKTRGRPRPKIRLSDLSQPVFDSVEAMCEWRLGREQPISEDVVPLDVKPEPMTLEEIIACLKCIQKSARRWNTEGGRQRYLQFVSDFIQ